MTSLNRVRVAACFAAASVTLSLVALGGPYVPKETGFKAHDLARAQPPVVEAPASPELEKQVGKAPSDAVVLFDGKDLSKWESKGKEPAFKVEDGVIVANGSDITTKEKFGDVQLHIEMQLPTGDNGKGQDRGNSGIKLMTQYEVQVLDAYKGENPTYSDGVTGAIYGQYPPQVNVCRAQGQWQTYDIVWRAPKRDESGEVVTPANATVVLNGVLVQDHVEILGNTSGAARGYKKHGDKEPLLLQWHNHPVKYRNIWIRPLDVPAAGAASATTGEEKK